MVNKTFFWEARGSLLKIKQKIYVNSRAGNTNSLDVALQFLPAAHGPVVSMKRRLHKRSHHASHRRFISAAVPLAVVLHAQPVPTQTDNVII